MDFNLYINEFIFFVQSLVLNIGIALPRVSLSILTFASITVPSFVYKAIIFLLVYLALLLTFKHRILILLISSTIAYRFVRWKYLTVYERLPPEPPQKRQEIDLFSAFEDNDEKPGIHNYLDEFLSAIKIFGYLERPVFHELTRHMQTRQLLAGDSLPLEEEKSFCLVVSGSVQVFARLSRYKGNHIRRTELSEDEENDQQSYQLLTEAKNGSPLSSLFTILSLFTENVSIQSNSVSVPTRRSPTSSKTGDGKESLDSGIPSIPELNESMASGKQRSNSMHPDIVARATEDSTIAVIPAEAFRRLVKVYPKASAHIVQVILTRFQRVTFLTSHRYLGLTEEVLRTEELLNSESTYELPNYLRGDTLACAKEIYMQKYNTEGTAGQSEEGIIFPFKRAIIERRRVNSLKIPLHFLPKKTSYRRSITGIESYNDRYRKEFSDERSPTMHGDSPISGANPDDLSTDQDIEFRDAVLKCMFNALGFNIIDDMQTTLCGQTGIETSPKLLSYDSERQKAVFIHAFSHSEPAFSSDSRSSVHEDDASINGSSRQSVQNELENEVDILFFPAGTTIVEQNERIPGLYYVIDGFLEIRTDRSSDRSIASLRRKLARDDWEASVNSSLVEGGTQDNHFFENTNWSWKASPRLEYAKSMTSLFIVKPGGVAGYLSCISGFRSFSEIRAKSDVLVGHLPRNVLERITERQPHVLLAMTKRLISYIDPLILHIDFALDWVQVKAGHVIYRQGQESDAFYFVLSGRVRSVRRQKHNGSVLNINQGEYGQGESVGDTDALMENLRSGTLHAIRDTELVRFPKSLFNTLAQEHPSVALRMTKMMANRISMMHYNNDSYADIKLLSHGSNQGLRKSVLNLRTIGIIPIAAEDPVSEFAQSLSAALTRMECSVKILGLEGVIQHLDRHAFNTIGKLRLSGYMADLEEKYDIVLYVANCSVTSPWTQQCIAQADCLLCVAIADADPEVGEYERFLLGQKTTARKELVLLHQNNWVRPGLTRCWLKHRIWIQSHHHLQMRVRTMLKTKSFLPHMSPPMRRTITTLKNKVQTLHYGLSRYASRVTRLDDPAENSDATKDSPSNDFARLARHLRGKSVGLVLGGGGARGISQVGVIRALEEAGIPIDIVGGTSIGAFVGGLYAMENDHLSIYGRAKKFAGRVASLWRMLLDITYPTTSYTTGHEFNRGIFKAFGDAHIEDFWLPFYCNTTNITHSRMEIHQSGYAWRYIRASMTLAGLLPPMCDEGSMLLDGGYIDNLTVTTMKSMGAEFVFAVDVGSVDDTSPMDYGDSLSGLWVVVNRWNPLSRHANVPALPEIQQRLAYVASVPALEKAKATGGCIYMRPPIENYATLQFGKFNEIYEIGYQYGKEFVENLKSRNALPGIVSAPVQKLNRGHLVRRSSV